MEVRASDEDRERVIDLLQRHTAAGRLTLDEFSERVADACAARTLTDLGVVTRDLPAEAVAEAPSRRERTDLVVLYAVAAVVLVLLALLMVLRRVLT